MIPFWTDAKYSKSAAGEDALNSIHNDHDRLLSFLVVDVNVSSGTPDVLAPYAEAKFSLTATGWKPEKGEFKFEGARPDD